MFAGFVFTEGCGGAGGGGAGFANGDWPKPEFILGLNPVGSMPYLVLFEHLRKVDLLLWIGLNPVGSAQRHKTRFSAY